MRAIFADTAFFIAYLNPRDDEHAAACEYMIHAADPLLTTAWVLVEVGNFLADGPNRRLFLPLVSSLRSERRVTIVPGDEALLSRGLRLCGDRPDKSWSVTDCISFTVMRERKLREALTTDRHFEQAGFRILL